MPVYITDEDLIQKFETVEGRQGFKGAFVQFVRDFQTEVSAADGNLWHASDAMQKKHSRATIYGAGGVSRYEVDMQTGEVTLIEESVWEKFVDKARQAGFRTSEEKRRDRVDNPKGPPRQIG